MLRCAPLLLAALVAVASSRKCANITVPVNLTAREAMFSIGPPSTEIEVTNLLLQIAWAGDNYTQQVLQGYHTVSGNYKLQTTYCTPDNGPGSTLQILTHGIGFDRSYWDPSFMNGNYSYVDQAVGQGYSTLSWDRLGVGESSHPKDPVNEAQIFLEIAALYELTSKFAKGGICGDPGYKNIVHAGHSFGSAITYSFANLYPKSTRAIALTGFSQIPIYLAEFALGGGFVPVKQTALADQYAVGYVAPQSSVGVQTNFFAPGQFDPAILPFAFQTGQPVTVGELLTIGSGAASKNTYGGPVLIITGERDIPFCGGNCTDTMALAAMGMSGAASNLIEASRMFFPNASSFKATIVPNTGHGLNYQYTQKFTFTNILSFFALANS